MQGWKRFLELASFVLRIIISEKDTYIVRPAISYLARISAGQPLLPAVQEIRCTGGSDVDTILLSVAGPSLRKLIIRGDYCDWRTTLSTSDAVQRLLYRLPQRTPDLRSLCACASNLKYSQDVGSSIRSLRRLRSLRVYWSSGSLRELLNDYLSVVSSLEDLRDLTLSIAKWGEVTLPNVSGFPPMRRLCLSGWGSNAYASSIPALYPLTASVPIEFLEVQDIPLHPGDERSVVKEYATIVSDLLATCAITLTVVKLDLGTSSFACIPASTLLQPLKQLRRLRVCDIYWRDGLKFGAGDLGEAASAWPQLMTFVLSWCWWGEMDTAPHFADVVHFMCACSRLAELQLPALAMGNEIPVDHDAIYTIPITCSVDEDSVHDPTRLARLLRSLLPKLRNIDKALKGAGPKWSVVLTELKKLILYSISR